MRDSTRDTSFSGRCDRRPAPIGISAKTMFSTIIRSPDHDEILSQSGGRGVTPRNPKFGIADTTAYASA